MGQASGASSGGGNWGETAGAATAAFGGLAGGVMGAYGAYEEGIAKSRADRYNAAMAGFNQVIANRNATWAGQAGDVAAGNVEMRGRAVVGQTKAQQGASGVDVNTGSAVDVRASEAGLAKLDALTVRSNAAKEAYGMRVKATEYGADKALDLYQSKLDREGADIGAATTFLGSMVETGENFAKFAAAGAI